MENEIGIRLRKFIVEQGLSIKEFAEKIGISPSSLTNYLLGKADIQKIFIALNQKADINLNWLVTGKGSSMINYFAFDHQSILDIAPIDMTTGQFIDIVVTGAKINKILSSPDAIRIAKALSLESLTPTSAP